MAEDIEWDNQSSDGDAEAEPSPKSQRTEPSRGRGDASTSSKGSGRHKPDTSRKGQKLCKACQKWLPVTEFALNQVVCSADKSILDVVAKKAKLQGKADWFKNVRADPKQLKSLVTNYKSAMQEAERTGVKRNFWNLATYMEEVKASSEDVGTERGQMMWKDQAIEFWQSTAGGSLQKYEAEGKWNHEAANAKELGTAQDQKGPKQAPLRLWVHTEDIIDKVRRYSRSKILVTC